MNKLNRMLVIMLIEITMILLTGCVPEKGASLVNDVMNAVKHKIENEWQSIESWVTEDDTESDYIDPETEEVSKKAYLIIRALKSRDEKTIFMMFNGYIRKNYKEKLENDINEVFDLVEGDIISFDKPSIYESSRTTDENGILIRCQYVSIYNMCTDKGKRYEIEFEFYDVNKKHQDGVGINTFSISDSDEYTEENDFPSDAVYTFGEYGDTYDAVLNR